MKNIVIVQKSSLQKVLKSEELNELLSDEGIIEKLYYPYK